MTKKQSINIIVWTIFSIGIFNYLNIQFGNKGNKDFKPYIAECQKMDDVNMIVEGRLYKKDKKLTGSAKRFILMNSFHWEAPQPKPIYVFKSKFAYQGFTPRRRNNINRSFAYIVREKEAPTDALGKKALICFKGTRPLTIEAIYIDD